MENQQALTAEGVKERFEKIRGKVSELDKMRAAVKFGSGLKPLSLRNIKRYLDGEIHMKHADSLVLGGKLIEFFEECAEATEMREQIVDQIAKAV